VIYKSITWRPCKSEKNMNNREKERRSGERRVADRRKQTVAVENDRRSSGDRRDTSDRRMGPERRTN